MKKDHVMQAFYRSQIAELLKSCNDTATLDFIYQTLTEDARTRHKERKVKRCTK